MKLDILAFGAHPDDIELGASGTLVKAVREGLKVGLVDLTQGELGTNGTIETRKIEATKALELMGASFRMNLGLRDGFFLIDENSIYSVAKLIRKFRPRIILANSVQDRHPDHGRAADLVEKSCFYSGLSKFEIYDEDGVKLERWRPERVLHYVQDYYAIPDVVVDISKDFDKKLELIKCFETQFINLSGTEETLTPINRHDFLQFVESRAREYGRSIHSDFGEGFISLTPIKIESLSCLLGPKVF